jgi:hypothetical protein
MLWNTEQKSLTISRDSLIHKYCLVKNTVRPDTSDGLEDFSQEDFLLYFIIHAPEPFWLVFCGVFLHLRNKSREQNQKIKRTGTGTDQISTV